MISTSPRALFGWFLRRAASPPDHEMAAYAARALPALDRAEGMYQEWIEQAAHLPDSDKLANSAAIHRWEAATLARTLGRVVPPQGLTRPHAALVDALLLASRAAQLLSSGSRFHNASAVCDGQLMLEESRKRRLAAARQLHSQLDRVLVQPPGSASVPDPPAGPEPLVPM